MARPRARLLRLVLAAAAAGATALVVISWADRRPALGVLPAGAAAAVEATGAGETLERIEGTRFAAAFATSGTRAWLEQSEAVRAFDQWRAEIGRATGFTPERRHLLDLVGTETAVAWYPPPPGSPEAPAPWVAAGRLSWRAWAVAGALRAAARAGLGAGAVGREQVDGTVVHALGSGPAATRVFFLGRLAVTGSDAALVHRAARVAAGREPALRDDADWTRAFQPLPAPRGLRLYARAGERAPFLPRGRSPQLRAVAAVVSTRGPVVADVFVEDPGAAQAAAAAGGGPPPLLGLAGEKPVAFVSSGSPAPPALGAWLAERAQQAARREGAAPRALPPLGRGFALAVTSMRESGLLPLPEGVLALGMRDEAGAREALRMLFPAGARTAQTRWGTAFTTRESLPLAGEFELWGAAAGRHLVFATRPELLGSLEKVERADTGPDSFVPGAPWPVDAVGTLDVARLLRPLGRFATPLAALVQARHPEAPDAARDVALLTAVRTIAVTSGTGAGGTLARLTAEVGDVSAAPAGGLPGPR